MFDTLPQSVIARVISNNGVLPGVYLIQLEAPEIVCMARPGQFVMLKCQGGVYLRRPLSIHRVYENKAQMDFLFAVVGKGTDWLSRIKPGQTVEIVGPLGQGFVVKPTAKNHLLVAGGLGMAPLRFLADELQKHGGRVKLLLGASTAEMLCPEYLLPSNTMCVLATDDGTRGYKGFITQCLPEYLPGVDQVFTCGPLPMLRTLANDFSLSGKDVQVSLEIRMACGLGVCYGCSIKTTHGVKQVCKDGPVFKLKDVVWDAMADI